MTTYRVHKHHITKTKTFTDYNLMLRYLIDCFVTLKEYPANEVDLFIDSEPIANLAIIRNISEVSDTLTLDTFYSKNPNRLYIKLVLENILKDLYHAKYIAAPPENLGVEWETTMLWNPVPFNSKITASDIDLALWLS